jgi:hypothetical protein
MALRKKEEEQERTIECSQKKALRAVYDEAVKLAREKRDKIKMEENIFDTALLETLLASLNDEKKQQLLHKVSASRASCSDAVDVAALIRFFLHSLRA